MFKAERTETIIDELYALADIIPQLVWIARADGYVEYHNQRWLDYIGLPVEQTLGDAWLEWSHPDERQEAWLVWQKALRTGELYEMEQRLRNGAGTYRWFLVRGIPRKDAQGVVLKWIGTCTDIHARKEAEQRLREGEEQWRVLAETLPQLVWATRSDGHLEYWNQRYSDYFGAQPEQLLGYAWRQFLHPEDYARVVTVRQRSLETGEPYEVAYRLREGRTGTYRWFLVRAMPVRDEAGQIIRWIGTCTDINDQKELEQRRDDFISMAGHELKTPLTSLKLQTQLLSKRLLKQGLDHSEPVLARIEAQVGLLERLISELLNVSRVQSGKLQYLQETIDLNELLRETAQAMQQISANHTIVVRGAEHLSLVGDRDRLGQVFTNLLTNAIKYSPQASLVEVDVDALPEAVSVSVRDQGIGIPREQREKIFERFYRAVDPARKEMSGLGIGLYIVAEIVQHYGGAITVDSEVGQGSTFHVILPRHSLS